MSSDNDIATCELSDGRSIACVNAYEVPFGWHEICSDHMLTEQLTFDPGAYIDVGANIGLFCIRLRDLCPKARIFAYEPMPRAFAALKQNARSLGSDVEAYQLAMGGAPGEAAFEHFPALTALSTANIPVGQTLADGLRSLLSGAGSEAIRNIMKTTGAESRMDDTSFIEQLFRSETVNARIVTLAGEAERLGISDIQLLKIDTEGSERAVLDGIGALWPRIRQLLVEVHGGAAEMDEIAAELRGRGYHVASDDHPLANGGAPVYHLYARRS
jgi:FkbM family methyltransferase